MKKITSIFLGMIMVMTAFLTGCNSKKVAGPVDKNSIKVGFLFVGPVGDGGWTDVHNEGRLYLEKELKVKTIFKENVKEDTAEVDKEIERMIDQGCNVIFGTSFGFMDGMEKSAKKHPDVYYMHCSGNKMSTNMGNYFGKMYEARYLSGIVAGLKTKTNKIGYVAAFEIPEVVNGINAFTLGVQSVNKNVVVKVKWTHTWYDPAKEKEAAKALLDEGVDIIAQHQDTAGPQQAAEERGCFSIGYDTDMSAKAPKAYMTAPIWHFGPYYAEVVKNVIDGTWKSEAYMGDMKGGMVDLAKLTSVAPSGASEKVEKATADIKSGKNKVFVGPIKDQSGNVKIESGKTMTDKEILTMDWFVQGVEGKIK